MPEQVQSQEEDPLTNQRREKCLNKGGRTDWSRDIVKDLISCRLKCILCVHSEPSVQCSFGPTAVPMLAVEGSDVSLKLKKRHV